MSDKHVPFGEVQIIPLSTNELPPNNSKGQSKPGFNLRLVNWRNWCSHSFIVSRFLDDLS
jgi:hypothetical protein